MVRPTRLSRLHLLRVAERSALARSGLRGSEGGARSACGGVRARAGFRSGRAQDGARFMWVNVLAPGGAHGGHIHPLSVLSGSYYVSTPEGASALKLEDPRLAQM